MLEQRIIWWIINELEAIFKIFNFIWTFWFPFNAWRNSRKISFKYFLEISMTSFQTQNFAYEEAIEWKFFKLNINNSVHDAIKCKNFQKTQEKVIKWHKNLHQVIFLCCAAMTNLHQVNIRVSFDKYLRLSSLVFLIWIFQRQKMIFSMLSFENLNNFDYF